MRGRFVTRAVPPSGPAASDPSSDGGKKGKAAPAASFLVGTKGIVAYTAYIEDRDQVSARQQSGLLLCGSSVPPARLPPLLLPAAALLLLPARQPPSHPATDPMLCAPRSAGGTPNHLGVCLQVALLELDWTNIVSLGDKRIWGDAAAQPPLSVESQATHSEHSVVTFNILKGLGTQRYWA